MMLRWIDSKGVGERDLVEAARPAEAHRRISLARFPEWNDDAGAILYWVLSDAYRHQDDHCR